MTKTQFTNALAVILLCVYVGFSACTTKSQKHEHNAPKQRVVVVDTIYVRDTIRQKVVQMAKPTVTRLSKGDSTLWYQERSLKMQAHVQDSIMRSQATDAAVTAGTVYVGYKTLEWLLK